MPVFEAVRSKQKGDVFALTARLSTHFKTTASHVSASRIRACRVPKKETRRHLPCEEGRDVGSPYRQRGTGGMFRPKCRTKPLRYILLRKFHDSRGCFSPLIRARWTVLFETAILPMSIPRLEQ
ncbi:hypothetical protein GWK47_009656 [Chionoecetes opilio]|uniref:Uncharacterized protein n=1 Tax=Chionoecetes opilio TaxID=41210 RepID=A0A8J5CQR8_CHIOP|nr:hypothetical protein GWK47_009656 [Chionoecetes opilio]